VKRISWWLSSLMAVGAMLCGTAWALSSPVGSSPDDTYHLTSIWCADRGDTADCEWVDDATVKVPALVARPACFAFNALQSGSCQDTITGDQTTVTVNRGDYPGGFYRVMHLFVGERVGVSVFVMRLVIVLLAVLLLGAVLVSGTRHTRRGQLYVLSVVLIPLGWFILASVNPSSWALTGITATGFALHTLFLVRQRWKVVTNTVVALAGAVMGLSARGDAAVYIVIVAAAVCTLHWRTLLARKALLAVPAVCCALSAFMALTSAQVSHVAGATPETDRAASEVLANLALDFPALINGMFGYGFGLGWLDTPVHYVTAFSITVLVGFLAMSGAGRGSKTKALAVLAIAVPMLAFPLLTLYRARLIILESVQPRYLLPLVPILLLVILTRRKPSRTLRLTSTQAWLMWTMVTLANAAALYANTRRYVTGYDGPVVLGPQEWWWHDLPGPITTWIVGSVGFAVFAWGLVPLSGKLPGHGTVTPAEVEAPARVRDHPRTPVPAEEATR
jgi:hypothetical protein